MDIEILEMAERKARFILHNSSPAMANAVASSSAYRVLIPMNLCSTYVAGVSGKSSVLMDDAVRHIGELLHEMEKSQ